MRPRRNATDSSVPDPGRRRRFHAGGTRRGGGDRRAVAGGGHSATGAVDPVQHSGRVGTPSGRLRPRGDGARRDHARRLTIRIEPTPEDGAPQRYWAVRWSEEIAGLKDKADVRGQLVRPGGRRDRRRTRADRNAALYQQGSEEDMANQARLLQERFDRFATMSLQSKTRNVKTTDSGEMGRCLATNSRWTRATTEQRGRGQDVAAGAHPASRWRRISVQVGTSELSSGFGRGGCHAAGAGRAGAHLEAAIPRIATVARDPITGGAHITKERGAA